MVYGLFISHTPYYPKKKKRTSKRSKTTSGFFWLGHLEETFSAAAGMEFRLFFIFQRHSSIGGCIDKKSIKTARFQADNHVIWCCVVRSPIQFFWRLLFFWQTKLHTSSAVRFHYATCCERNFWHLFTLQKVWFWNFQEGRWYYCYS